MNQTKKSNKIQVNFQNENQFYFPSNTISYHFQIPNVYSC